MPYRLTRGAEEQIDTILLRSAREFGIEAAGRYGHLILVVMEALGDEPNLPGSFNISGLPGIRAYPTRLGRSRVDPSRRVAAPRHLIVYRPASDGRVEILGVVHDRTVLSRAAGKLVRDTDDP